MFVSLRKKCLLVRLMASESYGQYGYANDKNLCPNCGTFVKILFSNSDASENSPTF